MSMRWSFSGWVWRAKFSQRPSVVGKWASSLCMVAGFSSTALGVRPGGVPAETVAQSRVQAAGQEGDKDVRLDPVLDLVINRTDRKVAFEVVERFFDLRQQHVELPEHVRGFVAEVAAKQVAPFAPAGFAQFLFAQREPLGRLPCSLRRPPGATRRHPAGDADLACPSLMSSGSRLTAMPWSSFRRFQSFLSAGGGASPALCRRDPGFGLGHKARCPAPGV